MTENNSMTIHELWTLFDRTRFAIARLRELELAQFGLTIEQSSVLAILTNYGGSTTAKELENLTMRQHHSVSTLISGMNKAGLVRKVKGGEERRLRVEITDEGERVFQKITSKYLDGNFSVLKEPEKQQLISCLYVLLDHARKLLGLAPSPYFYNRRDISNPDDESLQIRNLTMRELWSLLERTRFAISRLRELELARFGLTIEQASVLHILNAYSGSCTLKDVEHVTMRRQHSISCLIKGMFNSGLVEKTKNSGEKRFLITITPAGQKLFKEMTIKSLEDSFSILSARQRQEFAHCLDILLERARYLLGISYTPPFMQFLADKEHLNPDAKYSE